MCLFWAVLQCTHTHIPLDVNCPVDHPIGMSAGEKHTKICWKTKKQTWHPKIMVYQMPPLLDTQQKMLFSLNRSVRLVLPILISD